MPRADLPRVVMATDSLVPSGVGEHMLVLARAIEQSWRVVLAFPSDGGGPLFLDRAARAGLSVHALTGAEPFEFWLNADRPDLLHVHAGIGWEGHALAQAAWNARVPIVRTEHLPYVITDAAQKQAHWRGAALVDATVFVSEAAAETHRRAGALRGRAETILNGIGEPRPKRDRATMRSLLDIPQDAPAIIAVGRFTPQKGYCFLMEALPSVLARHPTALFLFAGDGPDLPDMQARATADGVDGAIRFLGDRDDVADLLGAADLLVSASLFEGLPLAVLEGMAVGLPIVATRIGGTCEALGNDYPWLVHPGAAALLATAVSAALADQVGRSELGRRNRQRFRQHFVAGRMGRQTVALYNSIISQKAQVA